MAKGQAGSFLVNYTIFDRRSNRDESLCDRLLRHPRRRRLRRLTKVLITILNLKKSRRLVYWNLIRTRMSPRLLLLLLLLLQVAQPAGCSLHSSLPPTPPCCRLAQADSGDNELSLDLAKLLRGKPYARSVAKSI